MRSDSILGTEICEALGLNPRDITALKVDVSPNRVEVVAVMLLREGQGTAFKEVLRRYRLVPERQACSSNTWSRTAGATRVSGWT